MFLKKPIVTITILLILLFNLLPAKAEIAEEWNLKGNEYLEEKEYDKALECYKQALKIDPSYARSVCNIGVVYARNGEYDKALEYYDKALDLVELKKDTSSSPLDKIYNNKGAALKNLRKCEEAIKCFNKALDINPNNESTWSNKGAALKNLGKYEEAIKCFNKALDINPNNEFTWSNKGDGFNLLGKYEEAAKCFNKALEINPNWDIGSPKIYNTQNNSQQKHNIKEAVLGTWVFEAYHQRDVIVLSETSYKYISTNIGGGITADNLNIVVIGTKSIEGKGEKWIYDDDTGIMTLYFTDATITETLTHPYFSSGKTILRRNEFETIYLVTTFVYRDGYWIINEPRSDYIKQ